MKPEQQEATCSIFRQPLPHLMGSPLVCEPLERVSLQPPPANPWQAFKVSQLCKPWVGWLVCFPWQQTLIILPQFRVLSFVPFSVVSSRTPPMYGGLADAGQLSSRSRQHHFFYCPVGFCRKEDHVHCVSGFPSPTSAFS